MRDYAELMKDLRDLSQDFYSDDSDEYTETKLAEAADAIEELQDQLRDATKMIPRWISVEDENNRPSCGERVNLTDGIAVFEGFLSISGKWMISFGEFAATHWMPLPAPPKEAE